MNFYITSNQFTFAGSFRYAKMRVMAKNQFYDQSNSATPCKGIGWWDFIGTSGGGMSDAPFTVQPALTFGTPGLEYFVNSGSSSGTVLRTRTVSGTWPNSTSTPPSISSATSVSATSYTASPDAPASGSTTSIDTGDARLYNAVYQGGFLYTAHTVGTPCTGSPSASCLRYYKINVSGTPSVSLQVSFNAGANSYYFYPAITPDADSNIYLVFSRAFPDTFVEARYTGRLTTDTATQV